MGGHACGAQGLPSYQHLLERPDIFSSRTTRQYLINPKAKSSPLCFLVSTVVVLASS